VISYYLADDTISVYCRSPLNSGLASGQFLNRGYHINTGSGKPFTAEDFHIGARLQFMSKTLEVDAVDDYSLAYTHLTINEIMALVRRKIEEKNANLRQAFMDMDEDGDFEMSYDEFTNALVGRNLNLEELLTTRDKLTLFRHFDKNGNGTITLKEFIETIEDGDPFHSHQDHTGLDPFEVFETKDMTEKEIEAYVDLANDNMLTGKKEMEVDNALNKFVQFTHSHRDSSHTFSIFHDIDQDKSGTITLEEFREVLMERIHMTQRDVDLVSEKFFKKGCNGIRYNNFVKALLQYTDSKKKGKFLGNGYKPKSMKGSSSSFDA
jgi:Ca2+-binding EF-hand superfamily protein